MNRYYNIKNVLFILFSCVSLLVFSQEKNNEWVLAVSQFKFENASALYSSYSKTVPEMFLTYLNGKAHRIELLSEKKMRALMRASSNRLKLIKEREKLIGEKDALFLSIDSEKNKKIKLKN